MEELDLEAEGWWRALLSEQRWKETAAGNKEGPVLKRKTSQDTKLCIISRGFSSRFVMKCHNSHV